MTIKSWLAGLAAVGAALAVGPAALASTHPASHTGTTVHHGTHLTAGMRLPGTALAHLVPNGKVNAIGLSGYVVLADRGRRLRFVSATFTVPTLNCRNSPLGRKGLADVEQWAGLDGFGFRNHTQELIATGELCDKTGTPTYVGFYDMAPRKPVLFGGIHPGDAITLSVYFNGSSYRLLLQDLTTGMSKKVFARCPRRSRCLDKSAEVITSGSGGGSNLANFGVIHYTGGQVTSVSGKHGTLAAKPRYWKSDKIIMVDGAGRKMAVPSALHRRGRAFSVSWVRPS